MSGGASGSGPTAGAGGGEPFGGSAGAGGAACEEDCASQGLLCCEGRCVNAGNDPHNCGGCGIECTGETSFCSNGCQVPPATCDSCSRDQICCMRMLGPWGVGCTEPVDGTCPIDCPLCVCADPDTPIATPDGERPIAELGVGDLVYSTDGQGTIVVPLLQVNRAAVHNHRVMRVTLATGRVLEVSAPHPTTDGRTFGDLVPGSRLDGVLVVGVEVEPYQHDFTYDILPDSPSGAYYAAGVAIGSTLAEPPASALE